MWSYSTVDQFHEILTFILFIYVLNVRGTIKVFDILWRCAIEKDTGSIDDLDSEINARGKWQSATLFSYAVSNQSELMRRNPVMKKHI